MQVVETYPKLQGYEKKDLVLQVLRHYVEDHLDGDEESAVLLFIDLFLPSIIDGIISLDKKELVIKVKKGLKACFPCF